MNYSDISNSSQLLVSVVILTKNRKKLLEKCLYSLIKQTYPVFEIIIVDDHSTDGTKDMIETFQNENMDVIFKQRDGVGLANGRNSGIMVSHGDIIAFLDDDCVAHPDWLKKGVETLSNENADIVRGAIILPNGKLYAELDVNNMKFGTGNIFYKKKIFTEIGFFDERFVYCAEDRDFGWTAVSHGYKLAVCPDSIVYHPFYYTTIISKLKRVWNVGRYRATNRVLLYKKHKEYRKELLLCVFLNKMHIVASSMILGLGVSLINYFFFNRVYIYWLSFIPFFVSYFLFRVFVDNKLHRYPIRIISFPVFVAIDIIETLYTLKGAIKYRFLIL